MRDELQIGIIGFGYAGRLHAEAAASIAGQRVIAIAESNPKALEAAPAGVQRLSDYRDLLALDLDVVAVCLPTALHPLVIAEALSAGKHVLSEKPLTATPAEADVLMAAAQSAGLTLYTGMTHRFYPEIREAKRRVDAGEIGEIVLLRDSILESVGFLGGSSWYGDAQAAGGGTVLSSGIHLVDRVLWFAGHAPTQVAGFVSHALLGGPVEDAAQMLITFGAHASAQLTFGWLAEAHPLVCDLEVIGTRGSIVVHTWQGYEVRNAQGHTSHAVYTNETHQHKVLQGLRGEWEEFTSAIRAGRSPWPDVQESTRALRVIATFYQAAANQQVLALDVSGTA